jgi:polyphosphate kinase 2 (PPK2 family)
MKHSQIIKRAREFAGPYRIDRPKEFRLKNVDPGDTLGYGDEEKPRAKEALATGIEVLAQLQDRLYAQDKWALLLIFQAMDAAGKDGAIKHVMSGVNPQGCQVSSFKTPSQEELDHDFLWRCLKVLPNRGHIGIFNRSYYEDVLVVRVHPELLARQKMIRRTSTPEAPWYVVPADNKWFTRIVVAAVVVQTLASLGLK